MTLYVNSPQEEIFFNNLKNYKDFSQNFSIHPYPSSPPSHCSENSFPTTNIETQIGFENQDDKKIVNCI